MAHLDEGEELAFKEFKENFCANIPYTISEYFGIEAGVTDFVVLEEIVISVSSYGKVRGRHNTVVCDANPHAHEEYPGRV